MAYFGRGPNRVRSPYTLPDIYKDYIKNIEEGSPYDIDYSTFVDICETFYKGVSEHLLEGGLYILPYSVGEISITGKRPKELNKKTLSIDWEATNKVGKKVYHLNDHSNYYKYRFAWSKVGNHIKNKTKYRLEFTRANKRKLASIIKSGEYNFFEAS